MKNSRICEIKATDLKDFPILEEIALQNGIDAVHVFLQKAAENNNNNGINIYIPSIRRIKPFIYRKVEEMKDLKVEQIAFELGISAKYTWNIKKELNINDDKYKRCNIEKLKRKRKIYENRVKELNQIIEKTENQMKVIN